MSAARQWCIFRSDSVESAVRISLRIAQRMYGGVEAKYSLPLPFLRYNMPSKHLYTIRRTILIGPIIAFLGGFGLVFLAPEMTLWGPVFWFGIAMTILYVLWTMATMLDEIYESA